jgi:MtN3 and saliva related transmembrane protein
MRELLVEAIGAGAAICSVTSFVPQLVKIVREKDAKAVSLRMYAVSVTGFTLWLAYGLLSQSLPLIASNGISLTLAAAILGLKLRYRRRNRAVAAPVRDA